MIFCLVGAGANLGRDSIFVQRRIEGRLQGLTTRFNLAYFERLMKFFVARPVRNLTWFAAVVPAKDKLC